MATLGATLSTVTYPSTGDDGWTPATGTWTYSSVDDPTGVFTVNADVTALIGMGDRIKFTNGGNVIYGKVSKAPTYSAPDTTITFLHQIDPADNLALVLMANSAITLPFYSHVKIPFGFPAELTKWQILILDTVDRSQGTPLANTIYNIGTTNSQISVPIGAWDLGYSVFLVSGLGSTTQAYPIAGLSTANNSFSNFAMVAMGGFNFVLGQLTGVGQQLSRRKLVTFATKTLHYLNGKILSTANPSTLLFYNSLSTMQLYAISTL